MLQEREWKETIQAHALELKKKEEECLELDNEK